MLKLLLGNPWIIVGLVAAFGALTGWAIWERHDAIAAAKGEKAALMQADLSAQDAKRWEAASDLRDQANAILTASVNKQNAALDAIRADNTALNAINAKYAADLRTVRETAQTQEQETKDDARQRPTEVHHLGAVACAQYRRLYGASSACTDTGAVAAN